MKTFTVKLNITIDAENEEQAHDFVLEYLGEIVQYQDLTGILIQEETQQ